MSTTLDEARETLAEALANWKRGLQREQSLMFAFDGYIDAKLAVFREEIAQLSRAPVGEDGDATPFAWCRKSPSGMEELAFTSQTTGGRPAGVGWSPLYIGRRWFPQHNPAEQNRNPAQRSVDFPWSGRLWL